MNFINTRLEQKELFFDLKSKMDSDYIEGWYIICKNDICLYVGQSKNLPSRIATHLKGKYSTADKILIIHKVYEDEIYGDNLLISEKLLIQSLTPIENIIADYSEKLPKDGNLTIYTKFFEYQFNHKMSGETKITLEMVKEMSDETIILDGKDGVIINQDTLPTLYNMPNFLSYLEKEITHIREHQKRDFIFTAELNKFIAEEVKLS